MDYSDECGCVENKETNYTLPQECTNPSTIGNSATIEPTQTPTVEDIAPSFSYCPENTLFLGFITYNDSLYLNSTNSNNKNEININNNEKNATTPVYWQTPILVDAEYFNLESQYESGYEFKAGFSRIDYTATTKDG